MAKEISALEVNHTWTLVPLPPGKRAIDSKWVYKVKFNPDGTLSCVLGGTPTRLCLSHSIALALRQGQHSKNEFTVEKNPTLEPDFQQSQNAGGSGMSSIPLMNPILGIKCWLLYTEAERERDAYAMRGQRAILLLIRRMKELVLQLSLLGLSPSCFFLFYPLPGTFPAGQGFMYRGARTSASLGYPLRAFGLARTAPGIDLRGWEV